MLKASTGSSGSTAQLHARSAGLLKPAVLLVLLMTLSPASTRNLSRAKRLKSHYLLCHLRCLTCKWRSACGKSAMMKNPDGRYFFSSALGAGLDAGLAGALPAFALNSTRITSNALSPTFSGKCTVAGVNIASPALTVRSSVLPSG